MKLLFSTLCDRAAERPDGKLAVEGITFSLHAPGFPAVQDRLTAVFVIEWAEDELGEQPLRADLLAPDGRKVLTIEGHTEVAPADGAPAQTRLIMPLEQVVFPAAGLYEFELLAGGDVIRACPLRILHRPES